MKRTLVLAVLFITAGMLWANGNREQVRELEGTVLSVEAAELGAMVRLQLRDGGEAEILVPEAELARLRLRLQEQVRVSGVLIEGDADAGLRTRLYARQVTAEGSTVSVQEPVRLREQDRERLELQTAEAARTQERTRTQTQTQSASGGSESGSGSGSGSGKK